MRIAVDGRHLTAARGVARYTDRVLGAMVAAFGNEDWRVFVPGHQVVPTPVPAIRHRLPSQALFGPAALLGRPRLERLAGGADVVWAPAPAPLAVGRDVGLVVTVHDLSWVSRLGDFTPYERLWHRLARFRAQFERADALIAVSASTKRALVEWGLPAEKITVVLSGPGLGGAVAPPGAAAPPGTPPRAGRPYFLAVGALEPRKAPELLARAFAAARARGLEADLVFAGEGRLAAEIEGPGVCVAGRADDARLHELYRGAIALVQPAWLEGFGLPPVEAAAHGTPSIVADLPVYAETLGAAAVRVPPGDEHALTDALLALAADPAERDRLGAAASTAVAALSWERAARETHAVLRAAAERAA